MMLDGLNPTNTFERKLLDVLVALATNGTPIPVQVSSAASYDDTKVRQAVVDLESRLAQVIVSLRQLEVDYQEMAKALGTHGHEVEGVEELRAQIAELYQLVQGRRVA